jgi:hypothetical protein
MSKRSNDLDTSEYFEFCEDIINEINKLNKPELTVESFLDQGRRSIWYRFRTESVTQEYSILISIRMGNNIYSRSENHKDKYKRAILGEIRRRYKEFKASMSKKTILKEVDEFLK